MTPDPCIPADLAPRPDDGTKPLFIPLRREYFEAEKDVWKMFVTISKERKRREIDPALSVLRSCADQTKGETSPAGKAFHTQMQELEEFVAFAGKVADVVAGMKHTSALQWAMRLLG